MNIHFDFCTLKQGIIVLVLLFLSLPASFASQPIEFKIGWDANLEEDLDGYEIFFREGHPGSNYKMIGDVYVDELADPDNPMVTITDLYNGVLADPTTPAFTVAQFDDNSTYYFALKAFDKDGNMSEFSQELCLEVSDTSVAECRSVNSVAESGGGGGGGGGG